MNDKTGNDDVLELTEDMAHVEDETQNGDSVSVERPSVSSVVAIPPMVVMKNAGYIDDNSSPDVDAAINAIDEIQAKQSGHTDIETATDSAQKKASDVAVVEEAPFQLEEDHVLVEGDEVSNLNEEPVEHAFDFGSPAMVFDDAPSEDSAGIHGDDDDYDVEISAGNESLSQQSELESSEDYDVDISVNTEDETFTGENYPVVNYNDEPVVDLTTIDEVESQPVFEPEEIDEDEIDEAEIEEIVSRPPADTKVHASPPPLKDKSKPINSFFKNDELAKAQAALKLKAKTQRHQGKREWWSSIFDDEYLMLEPELSSIENQKQIDFIQKSLSLPQNALILDLACGIGTNSIGMAKKNYRIVGVDLSLSMLARAGDAAQEAEQKINFIHGDMRDLGFDKTFDGVFSMNTSLGFFDEQTNINVLKNVYKALKPGGVFLLELVNRDFVIRQQPNMVWFQMDNMVCMEETDFNYINNRLYISRQIIIGDNERQTKHEFSIRLFSLNEIGQHLHHAGFAVRKVSGHRATPGAFFGSESPRIIIVAERRGD
ncbi:MAG: class I SAM-dependent methyltransferase [Deltaproteobacteria bacterium]|nr:class I SAM-dependent methyltransferase [Deltaproteobacteria bacterium]